MIIVGRMPYRGWVKGSYGDPKYMGPWRPRHW